MGLGHTLDLGHSGQNIEGEWSYADTYDVMGHLEILMVQEIIDLKLFGKVK